MGESSGPESGTSQAEVMFEAPAEPMFRIFIGLSGGCKQILT